MMSRFFISLSLLLSLTFSQNQKTSNQDIQELKTSTEELKAIKNERVLEEVKNNLVRKSARQNLDTLHATLYDSAARPPENIPTQKSSMTIYLDWQNPNKCVDAISSALKPHHAWRLLQEGRDVAKYRVPRSESKQAMESLKKIAPIKVFENHADVSQDLVHNASRYVAIDTLTRYYFQAIEESEQAVIISELSHALDQLEKERNDVVNEYLDLRLQTQSTELSIECWPFAPPVEGEARVAVPWINGLGVRSLERGY